jgi:DNA-binding CsgD family transcriptional regulator
MSTLSQALTPRELYYCKLLAEGFSNRYIARRTRVSEGYVGNKLSLIYRKLGFRNDKYSSSYDARILVALRYDREIGRVKTGDSE